MLVRGVQSSRSTEQWVQAGIFFVPYPWDVGFGDGRAAAKPLKTLLPCCESSRFIHRRVHCKNSPQRRRERRVLHRVLCARSVCVSAVKRPFCSRLIDGKSCSKRVCDPPLRARRSQTAEEHESCSKRVCDPPLRARRSQTAEEHESCSKRVCDPPLRARRSQTAEEHEFPSTESDPRFSAVCQVHPVVVG